MRNLFGCYDEVTNITHTQSKHEDNIGSPINQKEYENIHSPIFHNDCINYNSNNADKSRIYQSRRIRRCNWVRFLTVCENNSIEGSLNANLQCYRNKAGQVVYEVLETLEPGTELISKFKLQDTSCNNNNMEDCYKKPSSLVNYPTGFNILYSSQAIANMLLLDAISGIIKGNNIEHLSGHLKLF